jgi:hypothetical protein
MWMVALKVEKERKIKEIKICPYGKSNPQPLGCWSIVALKCPIVPLA